ncbi:polysaccharide pyruvyl transferase family protein [Moritella marina ATCC 15381]|uniref:Polysaccharide pyruvyl transferase family protein n=1 Tax=Moritella marina ATCC 15381 TaxID=1202962 RepID=A0A5J6WUP6_MORMI|nr:polysaccharide pyruvyl transferase family protein [Moritella marina]QFI40132.1 polysaccharide pyruvyl transferase family protein [Moritella marina ATCC 15381]
MKNIAIVPACTDLNRGDQALVWESVYFAEDIFKGKTDVRIIDTGDTDEERFIQTNQTGKEGFKLARNILGHPRRGRKSKSTAAHDDLLNIFLMITTGVCDFVRLSLLICFPQLYKILLSNKEQVNSFLFLKSCDAYFVKGGGFLHTYGKFTDFYYIWYQTFYILLGWRLNVKVFILPNSFGPFQRNSLATRYLSWILTTCKIVYAREKISKNVLENELKLKNVHYGPDFGYFIKRKKSNIKIDSNKTKVAITARPYRFPKSENPEDKYIEYIDAMAKFSDWLVREKNCEVYFITQVQGPSSHENDNIAISDIRQRTKEDNMHIDIEGDYRELADIYSQFDLVTGTRFHSVIFSQVFNVPAFAIAYGGNKSRGIMKELNLEKYVVDIEDASDSLLMEMYENITIHRHEYINELKLSKKVFEEERLNMLNMVRGYFV